MMNTRIKLLWTQAGGCYDGGGFSNCSQYTIEDLEKFAELIVRECQMQNVITACNLELDANPFVDQIAKHFGIES